MKSSELILRCYAKEEEGAWVAVCLDLNLAAQADSVDEAKQKLLSMIESYVTEALTTDSRYADQLLTRKAPWAEWVKYYYFCAKTALHQNSQIAFNEVMPLRPA